MLARSLWLLASLAGSATAQDSLVLDITPGSSGGYAGEAVSLGDRLLFRGPGAGPSALWISDGTATGTVPLLLTSGSGLDGASGFARLRDEVLFRGQAGAAAADALWRTDGSSAGTVEFADPLASYAGSGLPPGIGRLVATREQAFFFVESGDGPAYLWRSDGTAGGTAEVAPVALSTLATLAEPVPGETRVYWSNSCEVWTSDGSATGTVLLASFSCVLSAPEQLTVVGDRLFFVATGTPTGRQVWVSDGTPEGTGPVAAAPAPLEIWPFGSERLLFGRSFSQELWVTDGNDAGTSFVASIPGLANVVATGTTALVLAAPSVYRTDGTPAGTQALPGPSQVPFFTDQATAVGSGEDVVFAAEDFQGQQGVELWSSDGQSFDVLLDVSPSFADSFPSDFVRAGKRLFFRASRPDTGWELHAVPLATLGAFVAEPYGAGCGSGGSAPALGFLGEAVLGGPGTLTLADAAASAPAILFLGSSYAAVQLGQGCSLYVGGPSAIATSTTDPSGASELPLTLPTNGALLGVPIYLQQAVVSPQGPLSPGVELSGGLELILGLQ